MYRELNWMYSEVTYKRKKNNYNGKSLNVYKGDWKRKIKAVAKAMTYRLLEANKDCFDTLNFENPECSSTSKSTNSNYKLTKLEKEHVIDLYNSIPTFGNWKLSTGKVVDDQMKKLTEVNIRTPSTLADT
ncbi:hypothetical protein RO3G_10101 [Rhizopus delemar RA 99-880]|uniref:Uncharacterized protein n=1 Tax=Rhizopus delemar (strain RA 99-880 / ATCC MYA-4621 / FGSC 9543 / NRRL 43880) TaxID=246409 RepID=I1CAB1_RHIO9|nr:hypothetical protein RO3G_10101 [Rhizopus delemar RA 99-880]|eukprot:EIE85391.1 hypothetical protein RO3G_10101 [Rhizopus delemar RA 99-880]